MIPPLQPHPDHEPLVKEYEAAGFHHVHIRHDNPGLRYAHHYHPDHVTLEVLEGELQTDIDGQATVLRPGQKITIDAERFHTTVIGKQGCVYLHAEKHVTT